MKLSDNQSSFLVKREMDIFQVIELTENIARNMGFRNEETLFLKLVIEEACMNAYEYCQKTDQDVFQVRWSLTSELLDICIKHKGEIFPIAEEPKELNHGNRGRGLQLIKHIMDEVKVMKNGDYVELFMKKMISVNDV
ncbi:ATP-binding protein [Bacillus sp. Marseille-P3661]|uniref:ATP-binding protein n=1 Tax=Bacillus sp. Marseille-P3661 TaxID=1936234 RepID=UPI000C84FFEC|nr:ATP-binding protein [Bacillus sp. Marseille-P3661]